MSPRVELLVAMLLVGVAVVWVLQQHATRTAVTGADNYSVDPNEAGGGSP